MKRRFYLTDFSYYVLDFLGFLSGCLSRSMNAMPRLATDVTYFEYIVYIIQRIRGLLLYFLLHRSCKYKGIKTNSHQQPQ